MPWYRVDSLKMQPGFDEGQLRRAAAEKLQVPQAEIRSLRKLRQAVDARKRDAIRLVLCVAVELAREIGVSSLKDVTLYTAKSYEFPYQNCKAAKRPVVVGSGPAGIFCALMLARAGLKPLLVERGRDVRTRICDVERFFACGVLEPESNVQFGEGGAGTFSDGKLTTGTKDARQVLVLAQFVEAGAPADICWLAKPHIGTDRLRSVVQNLRAELIALGGEVAFGAKLVGLELQNNTLRAVRLADSAGEQRLETDCLVLAIGHSARDTFEMLHGVGLEMEQKPFAVGARIEHLQREIDIAQYGSRADFANLPVADYKLACHLENARSAFTFCVCPGGSVVAAASETEMAATNGMSEYARDGVNCNGALLVGVRPEDFGSAHPLAGIEFQRKLERAAFALGGGNYHVPAQTTSDFLAGRTSHSFGKVRPTYRPGVTAANLAECLPGFVVETLREAIPAFGRKIRGFDDPEAVLTAVESRSSSPVRIMRNEGYEATIRGVFPCGEGAGYAGGILSAAVDGVRCAEKICEKLEGGAF